MTYRLLDEQGLSLGPSSALNVAAAIKVAEKLGPGHKIVTVLCDRGDRYASNLFDRAWLSQNNLLEYIPPHLTHYIQ
jgi:cysteine synthase A